MKNVNVVIKRAVSVQLSGEEANLMTKFAAGEEITIDEFNTIARVVENTQDEINDQMIAMENNA